MTAPLFDSSMSVAEQPTEDLQPAASADIWGAFTPEAETPVENIATPIDAVRPDETFEPDVFAIVTEENDVQLVQSTPEADTPPSHTGSQWVPVEENTFEFEEEETVSDSIPADFAAQDVPPQETSFGDIAFDDEVDTLAAPVFSTDQETEFDDLVSPAAFKPLSAPATPFAPLADPIAVCAESPPEPNPSMPVTSADATAPAATLSEEQLRAILASVSKEVIERIVWEVVPDLAEVLIREAIRKIKEGA